MDAFLQELRRVRDGVDEQAARRRELEKCLDRIKMKDQGGDAVVLTDLCRSLELPIAKPSGGGMQRPALVEQIVAALLAELPAGASVDARKAAFVDASLQELRRVRDGLNEQAARRRELEKCLDKIKMKDRGGDAVVLTDLCRSLELPIAKPSGGGWMKGQNWWSRSYRPWWKKFLCLAGMSTNLLLTWQWRYVGRLMSRGVILILLRCCRWMTARL